MSDPVDFKGIAAGIQKAKQQFIADTLTRKADTVYAVDDYATMRGLLFDNVKKAVERRFPLYNDRYTLAVEDVAYEGPEELGPDEQKKALLTGGSVTRKLRGNWVLRDAVTEKELARTKRMTLANVPYMTDLGTFIRNGRTYAFTNILRLEPGVYTKAKPDEISAQFNIKQGTGAGFNLKLIPTTGIFQVSRGTQNAPAYTVFHDMGITDEQMEQAWGKELFEKNKEAGSGEKARQAANAIYQK